MTKPLKVSLAGLTMIQQSLLEFYINTREGADNFTVVLPGEAEAYITNFDEHGAMEAWENLYAHEKKPTLVLSNKNQLIDNYIYIAKPLTPGNLAEGAAKLYQLNSSISEGSSDSLETSDFLSFAVNEESQLNTEIPNDNHIQKNEVCPPTEFTGSAPISSNLVESQTFEAIDGIAFIEDDAPQSQSINNESSDSLGLEALSPSIIHTDESSNQNTSIPSTENTNNDAIPPLEEFSIDPIHDQTEDKQSHSQDGKVDIAPLSFDETLTTDEINNSESEDDDVTSSDNIEDFLDELNEEKSKKEKELLESKSEGSKEASDEPKEKIKTCDEERWDDLCGFSEDIDYETDSRSRSFYDPKETFIPQLNSTIEFTQKSNCWMELKFHDLNLLIDPESKTILSNLSIEEQTFTHVCRSNVKDNLELVEVEQARIDSLKDEEERSRSYPYTYIFDVFLWTASLLASHGRLPKGVSPDDRISINNWLNLNKVEKFPHIMQIAAVFNQHHASLNETATWMNLPKRYVYAFYNGVLALNMIEKNPEKMNKKKLISMIEAEEQHESKLKSILFKKII